MKKSIRSNAKRIAVASLLLAVTTGVIAIVHAGGLATRPVGEIHGKLEIIDDGGVQECMVTAKQTYSQATKEGTVHIAIKRDGARVASASARLKADTQELAAAAPSALLLYLTGRPARPGYKCQDIDEGGGRGLQCQDIKTDGNVRILLEQADKIIDWWDAQASLTHTGYVTPRPNLANLGKLQLSAHGPGGGHSLNGSSFAILLFDPADPTKVVGGRVVLEPVMVDLNVVSGSLQENTNTPTPGDFMLSFLTEGSHSFHAHLALDVLADGIVDVRGVTKSWPISLQATPSGPFVLEGVGNTKFVVPGQ